MESRLSQECQVVIVECTELTGSGFVGMGPEGGGSCSLSSGVTGGNTLDLPIGIYSVQETKCLSPHLDTIA